MPGTLRRMDQQPVADARANLSEIVNQVRIGRRLVKLTRRGAPQAVIVPVDVGDAIEAAGGPDAALKLLRREG